MDIYSSATNANRNAHGARLTGGPPQGATITAATLQIWVGSIGGFNDMDSLIYAEAADAAANYTTTAALWNTRVKTTANVAWSAAGLTASAWNTSPDITAVVQEVVSRAGYAGVINIMLFGGTATERFLEGDAWDRSNVHGLKLDITYSTGGGPMTTSFQLGTRPNPGPEILGRGPAMLPFERFGAQFEQTREILPPAPTDPGINPGIQPPLQRASVRPNFTGPPNIQPYERETFQQTTEILPVPTPASSDVMPVQWVPNPGPEIRERGPRLLPFERNLPFQQTTEILPPAATDPNITPGRDESVWEHGLHPRRGVGPNVLAPFAFRQFVPDTSPAAVNPDVSVALTGTAIAVSQGTLGVAFDIPITGTALTVAQGAAGVAFGLPLTSTALAISQGSLGVAFGVPITGIALTTAQGSLAYNLALTLTGIAQTIAQGNAGVAFDIPLLGTEIATAHGTLTPDISADLTVALTGIEITVAQGSLTAVVDQPAPPPPDVLPGGGGGQIGGYRTQPIPTRVRAPATPRPLRQRPVTVSRGAVFTVRPQLRGHGIVIQPMPERSTREPLPQPPRRDPVVVGPIPNYGEWARRALEVAPREPEAVLSAGANFPVIIGLAIGATIVIEPDDPDELFLLGLGDLE